MKSGMTYSQGSLVLVPFPFTDLSGAKKRPALVVSPDWFNRTYEDIILAAVTSANSTLREEIEVPLVQTDLSSGSIPQESLIKIAKLFTCHRDIVLKEVAKVSMKKVAEVLERLGEFFNG